jgi:thiamine kinase-like enzyme
MTSSNSSQILLDQAIQTLNLELESYCEQLNSKVNPRYFHANTYLPESAFPIWRLKVVNPEREDYCDIQNCNSYNNCVHARLAKSKILQSIVDIPDYFDVPTDSLNNISCSELVIGQDPNLDNLPLIADTLVKLRVSHQSLVNELDQLQKLTPRKINLYNQPGYENRLHSSLRSLVDRKLLSVEDEKKVKTIFNQNLPESLSQDRLTFCHGDFSYGNLKVRDNKLVFIDFEHSHIGIGEVDLAHLLVNLSANGENDDASMLFNLYKEKLVKQGLGFDNMGFHALVLERVAGKMNSMSETEGEKWKKLKVLLLSDGISPA